MPTETPQRKWQMMKIEAGLYLLPSNDERWVFKLHKRDIFTDRWETEWEVAVRDFDAFNYVVQMNQFTGRYSMDDLLHGDEWTHICYVGTRREAIDEAMAWEQGRRQDDD